MNIFSFIDSAREKKTAKNYCQDDANYSNDKRNNISFLLFLDEQEKNGSRGWSQSYKSIKQIIHKNHLRRELKG